jgi:hypothetical protein
VKYDDGGETVLKTGDAFYMSPGHTAVVEEDLKILDFSPEQEMNELIKHVEKKVDKANQ